MGAKSSAKAGAAACVPGDRDRRQPVDLSRALVEAFLTNERINQVLLDILDPEVWRAQPPCAKRRNIATTFAHMHNVRCMRLKMSARDEAPPAKLERGEVTVSEAKEALDTAPGDGASHRALARERRPRSRFPAGRGGSCVRGDHARCASPRANLPLGGTAWSAPDPGAATSDVGVGQALEGNRPGLIGRRRATMYQSTGWNSVREHAR